jgi:hypothetical protein
VAGHADVYRSVVRLYPKGFRSDYADDLVQNFEDLLADLGPARTWRRTTVDLLVTLPRYQMETVMNPRHTNTALVVATGAAVVLAAIAMFTGGIPGAPIWLLLAIVLLIATASRLGRSTRTPDAKRRRHLLLWAAALAVVCVVSTTAFWLEMGPDDDWNGGKVIFYNVWFLATSIGALVCLFLGLRTPRTGRAAEVAGAR